ncbi:MAG: hypothetical protein EOP50_11710, partial [Sphingobacteriales bacterium]
MKRVLFLFVLFVTALAQAQVRVVVHLDTSARQHYTGRLFLFTSTDTVRGVPDEPDISNPQPMYRKDVSRW